MPKISVIMPAYNAEKYIGEAIRSILGQSFRDFEFIILNDCSTDRTEDVIRSFDDPRIVYLKNERNMGVAATLNRGLAVAQGQYIARMDADDISHPERFGKQAAYLDIHPEVAVLGSDLECFNEDGVIRTGWSVSEPGQMKVDMFFSCGLAHPSVMMRADVIQALGGYDPDYNGLEDYELWCRVLEKHHITTLPQILLRYRIHGGQVTRNPSPLHRERMRRLKLRQARQLGLDPEKAEAYFRFCEEGKPDTVEGILTLDAFFVLAEQANDQKEIYDGEKLRAAFRGVILSGAAGLSRTERKKLAGKCHYLGKKQLFLLVCKQKIKKMLGRN